MTTNHKKYYLAIDIGASSGRHIVGSLENRKLVIDEVYRFENLIIEKDHSKCWDYEKIFSDVINGIKIAESKYNITSIGIDTWGVDFVLLDKDKKVIGNAVSYRDDRTSGMIDEMCNCFDKKEIYQRTGVQLMEFNTLFQLKYLSLRKKDELQRAKYFLMFSDYLYYRLTGEMFNEQTQLSTSQLLNIHTGEVDEEFLKGLGLHKDLFQKRVVPNTKVGKVRKAFTNNDIDVIAVACHDTGSAVLATPISNDSVYISSGTWSLVGIEEKSPIINRNTMIENFTNEVGVDKTYRFLKNVMGLWIMQCLKRDYNHQISFSKFVDLAKQEKQSQYLIDVNAHRFLSPSSMELEVQNYFEEKNHPIPETPGQIARVIFDSLANSYKENIDKLENLTGKTYHQINMVGGGIKNEFLCQLTADKTNLNVISGPVEATAIGNIISQMLCDKMIQTKEDARELILRSFEIKEYYPKK